MRKRKSVLKPLAVIFMVMFLLNMAVMYICFNINVIGTMALQKVMYLDMIRSLLSAVEYEGSGKIEPIEDATSEGPDNEPTVQGDSSTVQGDASMGSDTVSASRETTSAGPYTRSAGQDTASTGTDNTPTGQDDTPMSSETTSTGLDTVPTSTDTEASLYIMSPGTVAALQQLSIIDKLAALSILSKVGREEIDRIFEISNDGITFDEYEELRILAESRLKPSDMEELKKILSKNQGLLAQNSGE